MLQKPLYVVILAGSFLSGGSQAIAGDVAPTTNVGPTTVSTAPAVTLPVVPLTDASSSSTQNAAIQSPQSWNFHLQNTDILQGDPGFSAKYSGPNSLPKGGGIRETVSLDVLGGLRLWRGAEAHVDGLMFQGFGIGNAEGVEGFVSGEAYRVGTATPDGTITRLFIRQVIGFGGEHEDVPDGPLTLAGKQDVSRITLTAGRFSASDIFDTNAYANDPRRQFMNWGLINNEGWDYPADSLGYTTGIALELNQPVWTLRYGFFQVPRVQNGLNAEDAFLTWPYISPPNDGPFLRGWGMVTELERRFSMGDHPGTIRGLAFLNSADMARYSDATALLQSSGPGADISSAKAFRYKYGFGLNWEQELMKNVGIFSRVGWNDGQEQGWMFSDVDYTASLGLSIKGEAWNRPNDTFALAGLTNGISHAEKQFFEAGGLGILAGDGKLNYGWEKIIETYYDFAIWQSVHTSLDYQFIDDPAFNRDRGPVSVFGVRLHWEL
jgi:high affinity Mn2+ porin